MAGQAGPTPLIAGNWKMNGTVASAEALVRGLLARAAAPGEGGCDVLVCPPFTLVSRVAALVAGSRVLLGAQDCHAAAAGAHTGDISAEMLADLGCSHVIVGHSERRTDHGEDDAVVRAKAAAAMRAGLVPIVCIGETLAEREAGRAEDVVTAQLRGSLPDGAGAGTAVIAYEPVWAIGTGKTPTAAEIAAIHAAIHGCLGDLIADAGRVRVLYGGSVKPDNAAEILAIADVDGALVGGASLSDADFWAIAASCPG